MLFNICIGFCTYTLLMRFCSAVYHLCPLDMMQLYQSFAFKSQASMLHLDQMFLPVQSRNRVQHQKRRYNRCFWTLYIRIKTTVLIMPLLFLPYYKQSVVAHKSYEINPLVKMSSSHPRDQNQFSFSVYTLRLHLPQSINNSSILES